MTYNFMGQIAAQVITEDVAAGEIEYFPIETMYKGDAVLENYEGSIVYWYDNYIICFGYQKISNPANRDSASA